MQIVSKYLETPENFKRFKMINKKCARAVDGLRFNPIPITDNMNDELVHNLFPGLETQFLYSLSDRKIKIANEHGINLYGYDIKHIVINSTANDDDPLLKYLYIENGRYLTDIFLKRFRGKDIKFSRGIVYRYERYVDQKARLKNLEVRYKWSVESIFEKEKVLSKAQRELPVSNAKNRILKRLFLLDLSNKLAETMRQFIVIIRSERWEKLDKKDKDELITQKKRWKHKRYYDLLGPELAVQRWTQLHGR